MFYIADTHRPYSQHGIGTAGFQRIVCEYVVDVSELTNDQYQTFKGTLFALDLLKELVPDDTSSYVVRFTPDE